MAAEFKMKKVENVPSKRGGRTGEKLQAALEFTRDAGGDWCQVAEYDLPQSAAQCATTWKKHELAEGFEFCSRTVENDEGTKVGQVYARHVGNGQPQTKPRKSKKSKE